MSYRRPRPTHRTPTVGTLGGCPAPVDRDLRMAAHAWVDHDLPADDPTAYRILHHDAEGRAGIAECREGIAALNSPRCPVPDEDRPGVYRHLRQHLEDAGLPVERLRSWARGTVERRWLTDRIEVREDAGAPALEGHAAVFSQLSEPLGWGFREKIAPGAFADSIAASDDVRALFNHDRNLVLGRTSSRTLVLSEDSTGLHYRVILPDTQVARDLRVSVARGDITQSSFGFETLGEEWDYSGDTEIRTLTRVRLYDVSPVTFPAYPQTDVAARSSCGDLIAGASEAEIRAAADRIEHGASTPADHDLVTRAVRALLTVRGRTGATPKQARPNLLRLLCGVAERL